MKNKILDELKNHLNSISDAQFLLEWGSVSANEYGHEITVDDFLKQVDWPSAPDRQELLASNNMTSAYMPGSFFCNIAA